MLLAIMLVATAVPTLAAQPVVAVEHFPISVTVDPVQIEAPVTPLLPAPPTEEPVGQVLCVTVGNASDTTQTVRLDVMPTADATANVQAWYNDEGVWVNALTAGFAGPETGFELGPNETRVFNFYMLVESEFEYLVEFTATDPANGTEPIAPVVGVPIEGVVAPGTIAEVLTDDGRFTRLLEAVVAADLAGYFSDPDTGPVTLFAPTDAAFEEIIDLIGEDGWDDLLADQELLTMILTYHVLPDEYYAADLAAMTEPIVIETLLAGQSVTITFDNGNVYIDGYALVVDADIAASNGVIHAIDSVLFPEEPPGPLVTERLSGADRYATALEISQEAFLGFEGVTDVVVASGADRSAVDALAAAGLCGALDAPLLLVAPTGVPTAVRNAIAGMPENVTVHIIGGTAAVPAPVATQLAGITGVTSVNRVAGSDRYATARAIALEMSEELGAAMPDVALLANGAQPRSFFDALALAPIARNNNYPILLLQQNAIPSATATTLSQLNLTTRVIGGGTAVVSSGVASALDAPSGTTVMRWWGADRYGTAASIATNAVQQGWASYDAVGVAAAIPDAMTGGAAIGRLGGVLLLTQPNAVPAATANVLMTHGMHIQNLWVFGGPAVISNAVVLQLEVLATHDN